MSQSQPTQPGSTEAAPPVLNFRRLEKLQRLFGVVALVLLLLVCGAIVAASFKLRSQIAEIKSNEEFIERQQRAIVTCVNPATVLNPKQAKEVQQIIESNVPPGRDTERLIAARVYVHIRRNDQLERAGNIARLLRARGYIIPGIENVGDDSPDRTQLRYYQRDAVTNEDLRNMTEILAGAGVSLGEPEKFESAGVRPRHYELWFGKDF